MRPGVQPVIIGGSGYIIWQGPLIRPFSMLSMNVFFFTGGTPKQTGGVASQESIKQRIAELVGQEDSASPLSDDQLAALLKEKDNIKIARRTVTKYRKALSIPSSSQRRSF